MLERSLDLKRVRSCLVAFAVAFVPLQAAEEPTSDDFALRILPAAIELPAAPGEQTTLDLEVAVSSAVDGVQGWSYGIVLENDGLDTFFVENAREHADLAAVAGDAFTMGALEPGRPSFHIINYYAGEDFVNRAGSSQTPNEHFNDGIVEHDSLDGLPGEWTAVVQGCVLDLGAQITLPIVDDFGVLALKVRVQGEAPQSGRLTFTDTVGSPPVDVVIVWNGQGF